MENTSFVACASKIMAGKDGSRPSAYRLTQVGKLTLRGKESLRRLFAGDRPKNVAHDLGFTSIHLSKVKNSDVGKAYMAELEAKRDQAMDEVAKRLKDLEIKSVEVLERTHDAALLTKADGITPADFMDRHRACPTPSQIRAAERHLERQGYTAQSPVSTVLHVGTGKVLAELKQRHAAIQAKEREQIVQGEIVGTDPPGVAVGQGGRGTVTSEETKGDGES